MSGSNPGRVAVGVWALSTMLAGLAGVLVASTNGLTTAGMATLMAAAFAAVVAARLRSLVGAVLVSLAMGVVTDVVQEYLPPGSSFTAAIIPSIPFGFILVFLIVYLIRSGFVSDDAQAGGPLDQAIRPANRDTSAGSLTDLTTQKSLGSRVITVLPLIVVAVLPLVFRGSAFWLGLVAAGMCYAIAFLSFTVVTGEGGMLWLSQIIFAGGGALAAAQFATTWHLPVLVAIALGGASMAVVGAVIGLLTIRLGDLYVALVTLAFGLLVETLVFTLSRFAQGGLGVTLNRPSFASSDFAFCYLALVVFLIFAALTVNLRRSTSGLALHAVRDSEAASRTLGVSVVQVKVIVGALGAFVAAVGGGFLALDARVAQPQSFETFAGLVWLAVVVTLGIRSIAGAAIAGLTFALLPGVFQTYLPPRWGEVPAILFGLGAIGVARHPEGVVLQTARKLRSRLAHFASAPPAGAGSGAAELQELVRARACGLSDPGVSGAGHDRDRGCTMTTATPESRPGLSRDAGVGVASGNGAIPPARLACTGVTVRFGGLTAVQSVDLAVPPGAITGLVGPNGAGKSTLFGVVSGLLRPSAGKVFIDGEDVTGARPQVRAEKGLARTFQHPELFTGLVVRDHLVLAYRAKHAKARVWADLFTMGSLRRASVAEEETVDHLVELLGIKSIANTPALGLPLGLSRLVELGRALAASPTILLLDEPSSGLDSSETEQLEATLRRVAQESGVSVLLVEHDVELVMRLCATIYVLDFGELIAHGTPPEIRASDVVRSAYLGEEIEGEEALEEAADVEDAAEISDFLSKDTAATPTPAVPVQPGDQSRNDVAARLIVENLSVRYGEAIAVSGVSFSVGAGKALAILGANGAGKTSIARAISGLVPPCGGTVMFEGDETTSASPDRIRRAGLVHLPEGRGIFRSLTVSREPQNGDCDVEEPPRTTASGGEGLRDLSGPRAPSTTACRLLVRGRAADAVSRPCAHHVAEIAHRRRALARSGSDPCRPPLRRTHPCPQ